MSRESHRPTPILSLAVLTLLAAFGFGADAATAVFVPSQHTKTVCDWSFGSGPRQGQAGKESRRFYGHLPLLYGTTYWAGGANDTTTYRLEYPSGLWNPPGTRWHVSVETPTVTATLAVRQGTSTPPPNV